jgi:hypothetical protein
MIGRCFGSIEKEDYTLKEALAKIGAVSREFKVDGKDVLIKELTFGNLKALKEREFVSALAKVEVKYKKNLPVLDKQFNEILTQKGDFDERLFLPFWLMKDQIVFSSAQQSRDYLIPFLNEALKQKITIPHYNVKKIYDDYEPQDRVCGFGFMKRPDAISSGQVFGEIKSADPLVQQLEDSSKSFCAIALLFKNVEVKIAIYEVGTIVIHKNWAKMSSYRSSLKQIQDTLKSYEVF